MLHLCFLPLGLLVSVIFLLTLRTTRLLFHHVHYSCFPLFFSVSHYLTGAWLTMVSRQVPVITEKGEFFDKIASKRYWSSLKCLHQSVEVGFIPQHIPDNRSLLTAPSSALIIRQQHHALHIRDVIPFGYP